MAVSAPISAGASRLACIGYAMLAAIVGWWAWRAFSEPLTADLGLAYQAGQVAWSTGHPEHLYSWDGMPFLAAVMALVSQLVTVRAAADLLTGLNLILVLVVSGLVLRRLKGVLSYGWWWVAAFALLSFGPMMSSVWWKQINLIAVAAALAGFEQLRRGRPRGGAALMGLSIAIKPLFFLLPFLLLSRRRTRRWGAASLAWVVGLNLAAQAFLATRAHDLGALNPWPALQNFNDKVQPRYPWACNGENFAPVRSCVI
jgi:hypothetical protein